MVAHRPDVDEAECLLSAAIPCVLLWAQKLKPGTGFKPPHLAPSKSKGSCESPLGDSNPNRPPGQEGPFQTVLAYLGSSKRPKARSHSGASFNASPGKLAAPSGIGAPSPNAITRLGASNATLDQICCRMQPADLINSRFLLLLLQPNF
ncbi:hypothetical protein DSO57_1000306 [Entomophthora muscae]|uniref:Uncharacterized protein n=1 Tax=Entomophthora muscae TaxID=34485 RepID=A0ACC2TK99_9FUNG|nr:hypothetical protein DSO57_1000306 [Entomophthora muscae]